MMSAQESPSSHPSVSEITSDNIESTIRENDVVLLDFWASWCGPCYEFAGVYHEASLKHPEVLFGAIDTEVQHDLAEALHIRSIPTLMAFRAGRVVYAIAGALSRSELEEVISSVKDLNVDEIRPQMRARETE